MWSLVSYSFGLAPAQQLNVQSPLMPSQSINLSLPLSTTGVVQRMEPLGNLQVLIYVFILHIHGYRLHTRTHCIVWTVFLNFPFSEIVQFLDNFISSFVNHHLSSFFLNSRTVWLECFSCRITSVVDYSRQLYSLVTRWQWRTQSTCSTSVV